MGSPEERSIAAQSSLYEVEVYGSGAQTQVEKWGRQGGDLILRRCLVHKERRILYKFAVILATATQPMGGGELSD